MPTPLVARIQQIVFQHFAWLIGVTMIFSFIQQGVAQPYYYAAYGHNNGWLVSNTPTDEYHCTDCSFYRRGDIGEDFSSGISFDPDDSLFIMSYYPNTSIFQVNTVSAAPTLLMTAPEGVPKMGGMVAMGNGIFYSVPYLSTTSDSLYRWDVNTGIVTPVGKLNYHPTGDMWMANGNVYYVSWKSSVSMTIVKLDFVDPGNSEAILTISPNYKIFGLTATPIANIFMGFESNYFDDTHVITVNITDGTVTAICPVAKIFGGHSAHQMTSKYEHNINPYEVYLDLDCNNSSLATGSDYNSIPFNCFNEGGVPVADEDIRIRMDAPLVSVTLTLQDALDGASELLMSIGNTPGISVSGSGTTSITLQNQGSARIAEFQQALQLIRYDNLALSPTGGIRTVEVQFETGSGTLSNVARAYIDVVEIEQVQVELGEQLSFCDGASMVLTAGTIFYQYVWSTGETTNAITVDGGGAFSVTVSRAGLCPNADTVEVEELPVYSVLLTGDNYSCPGAEVNLILTSDAPFPLDVEIISSTLGSVWFTVDGQVAFSDFPFYNTEYFINEIIPSEPACLEAEDPDQVIEILPEIQTQALVSVCTGDSILLGTSWVSDTGTYIIEYESTGGCDSIVTYELSVLPAINVYVDQATCDSSLAGVYFSHLTNPDGCDTIVRKTILYHEPDTTQLLLTSCRQVDVGTATQIFANVIGCDSVVIATTTWEPPLDSTLVTVTSCDPLQWGSFPQLMTGPDGCDSIVVLQVVDGVPVTTFIQTTSCDSASLGVFEHHFLTAQSCDSMVITEVTFSDVITTSISGATCDPASAGVFVNTFTSVAGCDSIVTQTVALFPSHTNFISGTSCDPNASGIFVHTYTNVYGCDSIVHENITLLPGSETFLASTTCIAAEAGTFVNTLSNQYGCDSVVTAVMTLLPPDTNRIYQQTCDPGTVGTVESLFIANDGCDSLVIQTTSLYPLPQVSAAITSDYHGFGVSCYGAHDGDVTATALGSEPFVYNWSNGGSDLSLIGVPAGNYAVTLTDANGCETEELITLTEPAPLSVSLEWIVPNCFNPQGTVIAFENGGVLPFMFSLDGNAFQPSPEFEGLDPGNYTLYVQDANQCIANEYVTLDAPADMSVDLGPDREIRFGDSITLEALINFSLDSIAQIIWKTLPVANCQHCLAQRVSPATTTVYSIAIQDHAGCVVRDTMMVVLQYVNDIYIPNLFSPNGDGINDHFLITGSDELEEIESLRIYDRWGNLVFANQQFQPGDPDAAWDGTTRGRALDPAVFVYTAMIRWRDGRMELKQGDFTLIR